MAINNNDLHEQTTQEVLNQSQDKTYRVLAVESLGYDGQNIQRNPAAAVNQKITTVGSITYIGIAAPGTAQSVAKWQCKRIDSTDANNVLITWADSGNFSQVATDLTALTYS